MPFSNEVSSAIINPTNRITYSKINYFNRNKTTDYIKQFYIICDNIINILGILG